MGGRVAGGSMAISPLALLVNSLGADIWLGLIGCCEAGKQAND